MSGVIAGATGWYISNQHEARLEWVIHHCSCQEAHDAATTTTTTTTSSSSSSTSTSTSSSTSSSSTAQDSR